MKFCMFMTISFVLALQVSSQINVESFKKLREFVKPRPHSIGQLNAIPGTAEEYDAGKDVEVSPRKYCSKKQAESDDDQNVHDSFYFGQAEAGHQEIIDEQDGLMHSSMENPNQFLDRLDIAKDYYDTRFRPNYHGQPVDVHCSAYVGSISALSEAQQDFTLDFYFRQSWLDYRLRFDARKADENTIGNKNDTFVTLPADFMGYIWRPSTFFVNGKVSSFHHVTRHNGFIRIRPSGFVTQSMRITITASCYMNFRFFPLDHQRCPLIIEAFSLPAEDLIYHWSKDNGVSTLFGVPLATKHGKSDREVALERTRAVAFHTNVSTLPHLAISGYRATEEFIISHDGHNHSRLVLHIYFSRSLGFYIIQVYLPASLMVTTSWISFWISRNSAPARVTLSVTTVLTVVTLTLQDYHSALPKISYLKALDLFHMTCFIFVFLVLVEYAIVSYASKLHYRKLQKQHECKQSNTMKQTEQCNHNRPGMLFTSEGEAVTTGSSPWMAWLRTIVEVEQTESEASNFMSDMMARNENDGEISAFVTTMGYSLPSRIETASRILFPLSFIAFNVIYWQYYYFNHLDNIENDIGFVDF